MFMADEKGWARTTACACKAIATTRATQRLQPKKKQMPQLFAQSNNVNPNLLFLLSRSGAGGRSCRALLFLFLNHIFNEQGDVLAGCRMHQHIAIDIQQHLGIRHGMRKAARVQDVDRWVAFRTETTTAVLFIKVFAIHVIHVSASLCNADRLLDVRELLLDLLHLSLEICLKLVVLGILAIELASVVGLGAGLELFFLVCCFLHHIERIGHLGRCEGVLLHGTQGGGHRNAGDMRLTLSTNRIGNDGLQLLGRLDALEQLVGRMCGRLERLVQGSRRAARGQLWVQLHRCLYNLLQVCSSSAALGALVAGDRTCKDANDARGRHLEPRQAERGRWLGLCLALFRLRRCGG
ncbi:hypothetical protein CAOG_010153 [Capsaspora owczarzaki ATCC 30864]|uniref:Uncharacterized protein n=1 Tax=Capsaspora owczarzaki (strain ATCC 30864) TaxID=595528 RepID=A0A0D2X5F3_CAPO3|nr:hypothetical protein CAOG_010153 [Capsaspora owczarzaki ATCC 30864]